MHEFIMCSNISGVQVMIYVKIILHTSGFHEANEISETIAIKSM